MAELAELAGRELCRQGGELCMEVSWFSSMSMLGEAPPIGDGQATAGAGHAVARADGAGRATALPSYLKQMRP